MSEPNVADRSDAAQDLSWLARPLACAGRVVLSGLDPARLTDGDLRDICLRMLVIFDTIEMPRAEGRLMPIELFDRMDTLHSDVFHRVPRLSEWAGLISEFGQHYGLDGSGPIGVDEKFYREYTAQYGMPRA